MANLTWRSGSDNAAVATSVDLGTPSGASTNDLCVALLFSVDSEGSGAPVITFTGWTQIGTDQTFTASSLDIRFAAYYRILTGSDSFTFTTDKAGQGSGGEVGCWDNPNTSSPFDTHLFTPKTSATTDYGSAQITTAESNELLVHFGIGLSSATFSGQTLTERYDQAIGSVGGFIADGIQAGAGASGSKAATASLAETGCVILAAFKSEAEGGGGGGDAPSITTFGSLRPNVFAPGFGR
jgi:hypothetical protein